ncbi:hypothetical protein RJT34_20022 [Clitoria ternatea]|uniref:AAA+ ATPase At3g28540-like C-terminal domain-containing protein n=1 Tax=Clitoria ternatea TaxID=43366 RepID=A0AAN9P4L4_CLITE
MHQIQRVHMANHVVDCFSLLETCRSKILQEPRHSPPPQLMRVHVLAAHGLPLRREEAVPVGGDLATVREAEDDGSEGGEVRRRGRRILLKNYLGCEDGDLDESILKELEEVVELARMTPADISEVLNKNRHKKEKTVCELLETLKLKAEMNEKIES